MHLSTKKKERKREKSYLKEKPKMTKCTEKVTQHHAQRRMNSWFDFKISLETRLFDDSVIKTIHSQLNNMMTTHIETHEDRHRNINTHTQRGGGGKTRKEAMTRVIGDCLEMDEWIAVARNIKAYKILHIQAFDSHELFF